MKKATKKKVAKKKVAKKRAGVIESRLTAAANADVERIVDVPAADWSLARRIVWVRDRVTKLIKDTTVGSGRFQYKGISHDSVTAFLRPKLNQAGILVTLTCLNHECVETGTVTDKGRKVVQFRARYRVRFENIYRHTDYFSIEVVAFADDHGDKAPGKGASYAMKYALLKTFMIETGEEDEQREADGGERAGVIGDDDKAKADVWALADELYGDDAGTKLDAMAKRRFHQDGWHAIPLDRLDDVYRSLRSNFKREQAEGKR